MILDCPICNSTLKATYIRCRQATPFSTEFKHVNEYTNWLQYQPLVPTFKCPKGCCNIPAVTETELQQWVQDMVLGNREEKEK